MSAAVPLGSPLRPDVPPEGGSTEGHFPGTQPLVMSDAVMEIEPFHPGWRDGYGMRKENGDDQTHKTHNAISAQIAQNVAGHEDGPEVSRSLSSANERIIQQIPIRFVTDQSKIHAL